MPSTTIPDEFKDLLDAPVASLTTLGADGAPQATVTWFAYDPADGKVKISLSSDRQKTKNLLKRPQASLLILDLQNPMRYVDFRGTAVLELDEGFAWAIEHVNKKYNADVREYDAPGTNRYVVTIEPTNVYAVDMSAG